MRVLEVVVLSVATLIVVMLPLLDRMIVRRRPMMAPGEPFVAVWEVTDPGARLPGLVAVAVAELEAMVDGQGLKIVAPVVWRLSPGRLTAVARVVALPAILAPVPWECEDARADDVHWASGEPYDA